MNGTTAKCAIFGIAVALCMTGVRAQETGAAARLPAAPRDGVAWIVEGSPATAVWQDATAGNVARNFLYSVASPQVGTHWIGVTVVPADPTLRAQLALPPDEGVVVTNVDLNSPAWESGVAQHDILLRMADKPVSSPENLNQQVDVVGEQPVALLVLRSGKRLALQVKPKPAQLLHVNKFGALKLAEKMQSRMWIGVELATPDDALRTQLKLGEGQGFVITNVVDESPAAQAGIKKHDVLLLLGEKAIASPDDLRERLQEIGEKSVTVKLLREAKPISIDVTPQKHQESGPVEFEVTPAPISWQVLRPAVTGNVRIWPDATHTWSNTNPVLNFAWERGNPATPPGPQARLEELINQMKELQKKLEALSDDLKKQKAAAEGEKN